MCFFTVNINTLKQSLRFGIVEFFNDFLFTHWRTLYPKTPITPSPSTPLPKLSKPF